MIYFLISLLGTVISLTLLERMESRDDRRLQKYERIARVGVSSRNVRRGVIGHYFAKIGATMGGVWLAWMLCRMSAHGPLLSCAAATNVQPAQARQATGAFGR